VLPHRAVPSSAELIALSSQWEHEWRRAIAAAVAAPLGPDRAHVVAGITMGMISATVELWLGAGADGDLVAMVDDGFNLLAGGFGQLN
jgi:hypothetical protein